MEQTVSPQIAYNLLNKWQERPHIYFEDVLGAEKIWKLEDELLKACPRAIKEHKHIYVGSGHALGKDWTCGGLALWFLHCFCPSIVIETAPTDRQVKKIMWAETKKHWNKRKVDLGGTPYTTPYLEIRKEEWFLIGFTTKESGASKKAEGGKFQGFHSPNICVIVSEAQAVEDNIFDQIEAITTSATVLVIFIGNPTRASGRFAKGLKDKKNNIVFNFDCRENPNYIHRKTIIPGLCSYEWVEDKRQKWGEDSPLWQGRVMGQIPSKSINNVFAEEHIRIAKNRDVSGDQHNAGVALDVAGEGVDYNVGYAGRNGNVSKTMCKMNQPPSTNAVKALDMAKEVNGNFIVVDCDGMGIKDWQEIIKRDESRKYHVVKFHGSARFKKEPRADGNPQFYNLRAKAYMEVADETKAGRTSIPDDPELIEDLLEVKFFENKLGMIQLEEKEDIKERLDRSPSKGDAWIMYQWGIMQEYPRIELEKEYGDRVGHGEPVEAEEVTAISGYG